MIFDHYAAYSVVCAFVIFDLAARGYCTEITNETLLRRHLFYGCQCHIRPVANWTDTLRVYLDYSPIYLHNLDEVHQVFSIYGWLGTKWYLHDMGWNPEEFGGINFLTVQAKDIWFPNLAVINSVDDLYGDIFTKEAREGKLYSDGAFRINRPGTWNTICMLDVTYFPFDQQLCHIEIDSWTLPIPQLEIMGNGSVLKMGKMRPNGQWEVADAWVHVERTSTAFSTFQTLSFVFKMKRKPHYVALNFVLPSIGILLMELLIFMIPPDAGEKISLGITLLLAQTIFQLVMHEDLPETSDQFPVLSKPSLQSYHILCLGLFIVYRMQDVFANDILLTDLYILTAMLVSGVEIICTAIVLNIHHTSDTKEVPSWVRRTVLGTIAKCVGIRPARKRKQKWNFINMHTSSSYNVSNVIANPEVDGKEEEEEVVTWMDVARVIDRLLFYLFLLLTVGMTLACLLLSYYSPADINNPLAGYGYNYYPPER